MVDTNSVPGPNPGYDVVFTVDDYHDGPRRGVANFRGSPHYYTCVFDDKLDDYSDVYTLTPINQQALKAALESWEMFLRWRAAFEAGQVSRTTHPALPQDSNRYGEARRVLEQEIESKRGTAFRIRGDFEILGKSNVPRHATMPWQVKWSDQ